MTAELDLTFKTQPPPASKFHEPSIRWLFGVGLDRVSKEVCMAENSPAELARHGSTISLLWGALLIVLGMVAIGSPLLAALTVNVLVAWMIVLAGAVHMMLAFRAHGAGSMIWKLLVGLAYLCFGIYMITHPLLGVASLTLVIASLFLIEGILNIILFFKMRPMHGSTWVLVDGIITLLLGLMIYMQWPSSADWVIGTLVGISMIFSGVARIMMSLTVRRALSTVSQPSSSKLAA